MLRQLLGNFEALCKALGPISTIRGAVSKAHKWKVRAVQVELRVLQDRDFRMVQRLECTGLDRLFWALVAVPRLKVRV